jgi:hypothetical protein
MSCLRCDCANCCDQRVNDQFGGARIATGNRSEVNNSQVSVLNGAAGYLIDCG